MSNAKSMLESALDDIFEYCDNECISITVHDTDGDVSIERHEIEVEIDGNGDCWISVPNWCILMPVFASVYTMPEGLHARLIWFLQLEYFEFKMSALDHLTEQFGNISDR